MNAPLVTVWLVIANLVVYAAQAFLGDRVLLRLALWPPGEHLLGMIGERRIVAGFEPHQLLSYGFLHTDVIHLVFNLVGLVVFGPMIERCMGIRAFGFYYVVCLIAAGAAQILLGLGDSAGPTVGASGAVYGLLAAAASLYPQRPLPVLPGLNVSVRTLAWLLGGSALFHGVFGTRAGIAHFAHLGGMVGGWLLILYWRGRLPLKPRQWLEP
jgi:membrane associated rhomboid family serine protease